MSSPAVRQRGLDGLNGLNGLGGFRLGSGVLARVQEHCGDGRTRGFDGAVSACVVPYRGLKGSLRAPTGLEMAR